MKRSSKILYLTGTRAEYGLMKNTLKELNKKFDLSLIITGTHLSKKYGYTIDDIKKENFNIVGKIKIGYNENDPKFMADSIGKLITKVTIILQRVKPDIVLVEGDRGEQLAMAIASCTMNIPIVHTSGGVVTKSIDDYFRNAITKLSHIHLTPTKKSAERIRRMNEEPWRIHVVGTPINLEFRKIDIHKKLGLKRTNPIILVLQHSVTSQFEFARIQMRETLDAIKVLKYQTVIIYPNSDAGSNEIIKEIENCRNIHFIHIFKNLHSNIFMNLLSNADVIVGNSSAGIVEAPFFKLPAVNIGIRQSGREYGDNVIHVSHGKQKIARAIKMALSESFKKNIRFNPYRVRGKSEKNIVSVLLKVNKNPQLLTKKPLY